MKYPRYPKYKDSGVEWLGEVPEEWLVQRLKWSIQSCQNGVWGTEQKFDENDITCIRVADFDREKFTIASDQLTIRNILPKDRENKLLKYGDLLLEKSGGGDKQPVGVVVEFCQSFQAVTSNFIAKLTITSGQYFHFWLFVHASLYFMRINLRSINQSTGIQNLKQGQYFDENVAYPSFEEQKTISAFLDHETIKIDNLITEQAKLIALLQEKRQAVISHAVTKGLDPDVPMKDSGVEWLGMVPKVWDVALIKHYMSCITDGAHVSPETENGAYDFVSTKDIDGKNILFSECLKTSKESYDYLVKTGCQPLYGDVLFSKDGTIGRAAVVNFIKEFVVASSLIILRPNKQILVSEFFYYLCNSKYFIEQVNSYVKGAGLPRISIRNLQKTIGMFPPVSEQLNIVSYLDQETAKIDALTTQTEKAITLLKERRSALISAAVTGKIDVRGFAPKEAA